MALEIPLARYADEILGKLASATGSSNLAHVDGATLLGERAMLAGFPIPARASAGGGCRLYDAIGDTVALNLARPADRELLPALFATDSLDVDDDRAIAARIATSDAKSLVRRGREMGLAIASALERRPDAETFAELVTGLHVTAPTRRPTVIDLSALWAGPLAAHLLWLVGADAVKVESHARPDAMREGDTAFYSLLNQGKASVALDFTAASDRQTLLSMIAGADIVIEAARPRALMQLGIDAATIVRTRPGLVWMTITGHGACGEAANWIGFGDDCGVAGGLSAALHEATGRNGFVGDAIADPLTGIFAARIAWDCWSAGRGGRYAVAMSHVVAHCLSHARHADASGLKNSLVAWQSAAGQSFPRVARRPVGTVAAFGEHTREYRAQFATC